MFTVKVYIDAKLQRIDGLGLHVGEMICIAMRVLFL